MSTPVRWLKQFLPLTPTQIPPDMPPKKRKLSDLSEEETTTFYQLIQRFKEELDEEEDKATIESLARTYLHKAWRNSGKSYW